MKSIREVEEFVLHPNKLRDLSQGEIFAISRTVDPQWGLVQVAKAPEFEKWRVDSSAVISNLKAIRASYQTGNDSYLNLEQVSAQSGQPGLKSQSPEKSPRVTQETWN